MSSNAARPITRHPRTPRVLAFLGIAIGLIYLAVRAILTGSSVNPFLFWLLLAAEAYGVVRFVLLAIRTAQTPHVQHPEPLAIAVDIVIVASTERPDAVEPTIVGALRLRDAAHVVLCDISARPELRELAARHGIVYRPRPALVDSAAANVNALLPHLEGELLLLLDANDVPTATLLDELTGHFVDRHVAMVQPGQAFRSETQRAADDGEVDAVEGPAYWAGSAALFRRGSLRAVGGLTRGGTGFLSTSLKLRAAGSRLVNHDSATVWRLTPDTPTSLHGAWGAPWITILQGIWVLTTARVTFRERLSDLSLALRQVIPLQRLTYLSVLVLYIVFGIAPVSIPSALLMIPLAAWILVQAIVVRDVRRAARGIPVIRVSPGAGATVGKTRAGLIVALVMVGVILVRWADLASAAITGQQLLPPIDMGALVATSVGVLVHAGLSVRASLIARKRRQFRRYWRFPVALRAVVGGLSVQCIDLNQGGGAFLLPAGTLTKGRQVPVEIECQDASGTLLTARGLFTATSLRAATSSGVTDRVGGSIDWDSQASRLIVIEQCYVAAAGPQGDPRRNRLGLRLPVQLPSRVGGVAATCIEVSEQGVAFIVPESYWRVGELIVAEVVLRNGSLAQGFMELRTLAPQADGTVRIGGIGSWNETEWLAEYAVTSTVSHQV